MGKTMVILKITPVDMEKIEETVAQVRTITSGEVKDVQIDEIGFGVKLVKAGILLPEKDDAALPALEKELSELSSVEAVEVEGMTLL